MARTLGLVFFKKLGDGHVRSMTNIKYVNVLDYSFIGLNILYAS